MHPILSAQQPQHLAVGEDAGAVFLGVQDVGGGQAEGIDGAIRNMDGTYHRRVGVGFEPQRLAGIQLAGVDTGLGAGLHEGALEIDVIFRQGEEEAAGRLHAVAGDPLEDAVLLNALAGGLRIRHRVAGPRMEQAVVAPGGACGYVVPLQQDAVDAAQRAVAHDAGPGGATPYDDDFCGDSFHSCPSHLFQMRPVWRLSG
ncbi:hypothetical protein D3C76_676140 [compost metagenome]